jgi:Zn finger protein HypA/HybF involved in hydrogenase expression
MAGGVSGDSARGTPRGSARMTVEALYPAWPDVRCTNCGHLYTVDAATGRAAGGCPGCGSGKYNTHMPAVDMDVHMHVPGGAVC